MGDYVIEQVQCGEEEGGMACGPVSGAGIVEMRLRADDGTVRYLSAAWLTECVLFYLTDRSTFRDQVEMDDDEDFIELLEDSLLAELGDFGEYMRDPDPEWHTAFLSILYIFWGHDDDFASELEGKRLSEAKIPDPDFIPDLLSEYEDEEDEG